ncbi:MAG: Rne/Rng family ribonuclease [Maricaulaceae bacterium]
MSKKMLIDASHPEETRVVIVNGTRVEELDFESRNKRQIRGNVYLARVTRVEPSLQAAFVEYGGNRHGFLAFSEIHPDYYQIPYEDRIALIEADEAEAKEEADDEDDDDIEDAEIASDEDDDFEDEDDASDEDDDDSLEEDATDENDAEVAVEQSKTARTRQKRINRRRYKIQEVIKRGQILLIQAVKEERGNKGAALTTYLSLAGRYCVFMPNTPRGGGISRKISNSADRKHLKAIVKDLDVPPGIGVIVRTAGAKKTKTDIKRDYEYLSRLWSTIRETTLKSIAPALIHEEGNLVKRSIRDLYNKDIDEILVQGETAYTSAKDFIKTLMPSHAKKVVHYKDTIPLFLRYEVEKQIENSLKSVVQLSSGGYLVIHPTEALVSVDVNSGRSTKERNVERTALKTNLEAAEEVARQMRLRDLAGLVVIDFIDMDENRNNRAVEKRMKESLTKDRARVQMSRISQFGLMEISRQRRRRSLLEGSTASCNHCDGVGRKRTVESSALAAIRAVEEIGARGQAKRVKLKVSPDVALYIFNEKRNLLTKVDEEFNLFTELSGDENLIRPSYAIEIVEKTSGVDDKLDEIERENKKAEKENQKKRTRRKKPTDDEDKDEAENSKSEETENAQEDNHDEEGGRKRRRRRGRRGGRNKRRDETRDTDETGDNSDAAQDQDACDTENDDAPKAKRGRSARRKAPRSKNESPDVNDESNTEANAAAEAPVEESGKKRRRAAPKRKKAEVSDADTDVAAESAPEEKPAKATPKRKGVRKAPSRKPTKTNASDDNAPDVDNAVEEPKEKPKAKRAASGRRKAPAKKKADVETVEETETAKPATRKRKAPAKAKADKEAEPVEADAKKTRAKKAPAKKTATKKAPAKKASTKKEASEEELTPKKAATKKAPTKKAPARKTAASKAKVESADDEAPAAKPARKAAPKKKATPKADAKKAPVKKSSTAKPAAKKAPAKKTADKADEEAPKKAAPRKKAPARKEAAETAPKTDAADSAPEADLPTGATDADGKKKGWWKRIIK